MKQFEQSQMATSSGIALMAIIGKNTTKPDLWIADSGCTSHITADSSNMVECKSLQNPVGISLGENHKIEAVAVGNIPLLNGALKNVYHVPQLKANPFSVSGATDNELSFSGDKQTIRFTLEGREILKGTRKDGVFLINMPIVNQEMALVSTAEKWHKKLGHIPLEVIKKMAESNLVDGLDLTPEREHWCADCALNKCTRKSHKIRTCLIATTASSNTQHLSPR